HLPQAETFFEKMAKKYGKIPNVIFEICNEPNGNTTWEQVSEYANTIIPIIREHSQNLILVGTPNWSQDIDQAAKAPLDHEDIAYTLHFYAATHKDDLRAKYESVVNKIPIVVSEFGICDASGNGTIDEESANAWMKLLDQYNTGRILWNASNKDESSSIFKPETDLTNWTLNDLSASGKWLLAQTKEQANKTGTEKEQAKQAVKKTEHAKEVTLQIDQTNDWQENGKQFVQLNGTVTNQTSSMISSWQFRLAFPEPVRISDHWNCEAEQTDEKTILIRNVDYNGKLESKKSATDVGLIVSSGSKVEINNMAIE
uniref:cellulase family glycosylhydrolase n=1 Tax=uncultured Dubosiella sp. TaxID=1937011 RepID=UPI00262B5D38